MTVLNFPVSCTNPNLRFLTQCLAETSYLLNIFQVCTQSKHTQSAQHLPFTRLRVSAVNCCCNLKGFQATTAATTRPSMLTIATPSAIVTAMFIQRNKQRVKCGRPCAAQPPWLKWAEMRGVANGGAYPHTQIVARCASVAYCLMAILMVALVLVVVVRTIGS